VYDYAGRDRCNLAVEHELALLEASIAERVAAADSEGRANKIAREGDKVKLLMTNAVTRCHSEPWSRARISCVVGAMTISEAVRCETATENAF
jgi:hypothetical protein